MSDTYIEQLQQLARDTPPVGDLVVAILTLRAIHDLVTCPAAFGDPPLVITMVTKEVAECLDKIDPQKVL